MLPYPNSESQSSGNHCSTPSSTAMPWQLWMTWPSVHMPWFGTPVGCSTIYCADRSATNSSMNFTVASNVCTSSGTIVAHCLSNHFATIAVQTPRDAANMKPGTLPRKIGDPSTLRLGWLARIASNARSPQSRLTSSQETAIVCRRGGLRWLTVVGESCG